MSPLPENIIDAHVHFWHPDQVYIPWMRNTAFNKRLDAEQYALDVEKVKVSSAVYVETDVHPVHGLVEADWIRRYSEEIKPSAAFGGISAIVAYAPVDHGKDVQGYIDMLIKVAGDKLRGVRHLIQDPSLDPWRVTDPSFVQGVQMLGKYGLTFDLNINCHAAPEQFPPLQILVSQCPHVQFVLDHMAKPPCDRSPGEPEFEFWKSQLIALAEYPNVACKVSGLVTETEEQDSRGLVQRLQPFVEVALTAFGEDRLMFGGDWSICESAVPWQTWIEVLVEIVKGWSEEARDKLFRRNAARIYRL
ncbi:uncharacterized protein BYT42DRAFT_545757 [Radiomyces spectabilis]|uniref:uncharacterized protein n=1 Tax=Radiomyces spectabilis TaxID=64574 RepID=UPI00221F566D|nr:uncharacterized protein BYT42DRAFT_545757 [Radiomyces spectabilis]KAI8379398.1 hypothetical protein BYT42DRAFT_545757 [Radiomyces spectabilis]